MVNRDMEAVNKEKQDLQSKRHQRNQTASFNFENYHKQMMMKKMEREDEKRAFSLKRGVYNSTDPLNAENLFVYSNIPEQSENSQINGKVMSPGSANIE